MDQSTVFTHEFASPFGRGRGVVRMALPDNITAGQIAQVPAAAEQLVVLLTDDAAAEIPITIVGLTALRLIAKTMPPELAADEDGQRLVGWVGVVSFLRQILQYVGQNRQVRAADYQAAVLQYCDRYGPRFVDALTVRMPVLLEQVRASDSATSAGKKRVERLEHLCDLTLDIAADLEDIWGSDRFAEWQAKSVAPSPQVSSRKLGGGDEKRPTSPVKKEKEEHTPPSKDDAASTPEMAEDGSLMDDATQKDAPSPKDEREKVSDPDENEDEDEKEGGDDVQEEEEEAEDGIGSDDQYGMHLEPEGDYSLDDDPIATDSPKDDEAETTTATKKKKKSAAAGRRKKH